MLQAFKATRSGGLYACLNCMNACVAFRNGQEVECEEIEDFIDLRLIAPKGTQESVCLGCITKALDDLPTLPSVPQRVMRMVYDPITSIADIARVLNEDPVIALKVLKLANCAFYGGRQKITSLDVACARLGIKMIVKMVQAIGSKDLFKTQNKELRQTMQALWRHSVVTAYCAGEIASLMPILSNEEIFLAGLVHDIGKVVLLNIRSQLQNDKCLQGMNEEETEHFIRSFHALAGLHAAQNWDLSTELRVATFFHHVPDSAPVEEWRPLAHIVRLADTMSTKLGYSDVPPTDKGYADHSSVAFLKLEPDRVEEIQAGIGEQLGDLLNAIE